jgi:hypothetical protein
MEQARRLAQVAPSEPIHEPTGWTIEDAKDLLALAKIQIERDLEPAERIRMKKILGPHRFERLSDDALRLIQDIQAGNSRK